MTSEGKTIEITTGTIVRAILLILAVALIFYLRDLVLIILTAVVIASSIEPGIAHLKKWRVSRLPAVIMLYLSVAVVFISTFYFLVPPLLDDAINFLNTLPDKLALIEKKSVESIDPQMFSQFNDFVPLKDVFEGVRSVATDVSGGIFKTTNALFGGVLSFVLIIVLSFYFAVQETGVDDFLRVVTPIKNQKYVLSLWKRSQIKIGLWMQGQLLLGLIVGVLTYLGLTILGVPYALLLSILMIFFELIPVFGPIIGAVPAVIIAFATGGASLGFFTVGLYVIIQQFENHLIYPLVVQKVVGVPPLLVIIALIAGAQIAGFLGILLSVPFAAALKEYIDDVNLAKLHGKELKI